MKQTPIIDNLINELKEQGFEIGVFKTDADIEYHLDYRTYDYVKKKIKKPSRRLNKEIAKDIRKEYKDGSTLRALSKKHNVSLMAIHHIVTYKNYKN